MAATDPASADDSNLHAQQLRAAMSRFPTGVSVVTALTEAGPSGLAANAVSSLSLDPPLMLVCVDRGSRTLRALETAGRFGVNVLAGHAADLAVGFGSKAPTAEKWEGVGWRESDGIPVLDDAIVWIGCELRDVISGGDHVIVTGEVLAVEERDGAPLLFHAGTYRELDAGT
ncbi:MAG: flavin reductase family protein [Solirubrobacterales bacterium]